MSNSLEQVTITCDICGSNKSGPEFEKDGFSAVRCADCGLVYVNPQPSPEYLKNEVYGKHYFNAEKGYGIEDMLGKGQKESRQRAEKLFKRLERNMAPGSVLDVGCAAGFMLDTARKRGWKVRGVDISDYAARHAVEELGIEVQAGRFTDINLPANEFDLVLMLDVIEHFASPRKALLKAHEVLKPGGKLVMGTPNYDSAPARALGTAWGLIAPEHHLFYFTPETISRLIGDAGFEIVSMEFPQWGLAELLFSAGSFQKVGLPVGDGQKQFVRKYLKAPRDLVRSVTSFIDRLFLVPLFRHRGGSAIFLDLKKN